MKLLVATLATTAVALAAPSVGSAATLSVDNAQPCYREEQSIFLIGEGFTPNARVDFFSNGDPVPLPKDAPPLRADGVGALSLKLTLREILSGQRVFTYLAREAANPDSSAELRLRVTNTGVSAKPESGEPDRLFTIRARGFFEGGKTLWAHVVRKGSGKSRNLRVGRIKGPCKRVRAKRRFFSADAPSGRYRIQFDAFRRYRKDRPVKSIYNMRISRTAVPAASGRRIR
jgi:hypothetical protein